MCAYVLPEPASPCMGQLPDRRIARGGPEQANLIALSRELRLASADFRSLALHAGPMHRLTVDAKGRVDHFAALLHAETEKLRSAMTAPA